MATSPDCFVFYPPCQPCREIFQRHLMSYSTAGLSLCRCCMLSWSCSAWILSLCNRTLKTVLYPSSHDGKGGRHLASTSTIHPPCNCKKQQSADKMQDQWQVKMQCYNHHERVTRHSRPNPAGSRLQGMYSISTESRTQTSECLRVAEHLCFIFACDHFCLCFAVA